MKILGIETSCDETAAAKVLSLSEHVRKEEAADMYQIISEE